MVKDLFSSCGLTKENEGKDSYSFFVPCPVPRGERPCKNALPKGDYEIHQPEPSKEVKDLHPQEIAVRKNTTRYLQKAFVFTLRKGQTNLF